MILDFLCQAKYSLFREWQSYYLNVNRESNTVTHCLLNDCGDIIVPVTLIELFIFARDGHWNAARTHRQNVPYKSISAKKSCSIRHSVIGCLRTKTWTHNEIQFRFAPIRYPLRFQFMSTARVHKIFVSRKFFCRIHNHAQTWLLQPH